MRRHIAKRVDFILGQFAAGEHLLLEEVNVYIIG
jgi:hypothetical protein